MYVLCLNVVWYVIVWYSIIWYRSLRPYSRPWGLLGPIGRLVGPLGALEEAPTVVDRNPASPGTCLYVLCCDKSYVLV